MSQYCQIVSTQETSATCSGYELIAWILFAKQFTIDKSDRMSIRDGHLCKEV